MALTVLLVSLFALLALKMPIGMALAVSSTAYLLTSERSFPLNIMVERMISGLDSYPFLAVPFFIMAARFMNSAGVTQRIFDFALSIVGHIRGGLGHVNIMASMIFAGMSGAAVADTAGLGLIEIRAMVKEGYSRHFAAAVTAASAIIGPIIPPSITLVIYGVLAEASIGRLFLAGVAPGIVMGLSMMITVYYLGVTGKEPMPLRPWQNLCQVWVAFRRAFLTLLAPLILLGGIAFGIVTPTEAGVVAVLYAVVLGLCYREIVFRELPGILNDTALQTATVMFILAGASIFGWIMTIERVPTYATLLIIDITDNPMLILLLLNIMLLCLGMFLNSSTILVLTIPIIKPLIVTLGIDPVHFGIVMTFNVMRTRRSCPPATPAAAPTSPTSVTASSASRQSSARRSKAGPSLPSSSPSPTPLLSSVILGMNKVDQVETAIAAADGHYPDPSFIQRVHTTNTRA